MTLSDILMVSLPDDYIFNFHHLGTLFCLDNNKDGRFSLEDLLAFSEEALSTIKKVSKQHESNAQLQAHCTLKLWTAVCGDEAKEADFEAWLSRLLYENTNGVKMFDECPDV